MSTPAQQAAQVIMKRWEERTKVHGGMFLRHLDGDFKNEAPANIEKVHPFDSFSALLNGEDHADNWSVGLTEEQCAFVRAYAWNFCVTYQAVGREPQEPPLESVAEMQEQMDRAMADPEVAGLTADGDAAMEAGDFERAMEIYAQAKEKRDQLLPAVEGPGDMIFPGQAEKPSKPLHGRRSATNLSDPLRDRPSILSSTPSRRQQPLGAPSRKEEVAARIAARNAAPLR